MGRWLNIRVENSHLPFRRREQAMPRFRRMKSLQKFVSVHASLHNHFYSDANSSTVKPTGFAVLPPWPCGIHSRPKNPRSRLSCANRR